MIHKKKATTCLGGIKESFPPPSERKEGGTKPLKTVSRVFRPAAYNQVPGSHFAGPDTGALIAVPATILAWSHFADTKVKNRLANRVLSSHSPRFVRRDPGGSS